MNPFYISLVIIGFLCGAVYDCIINLLEACSAIPDDGPATGHQRSQGDTE